MAIAVALIAALGFGLFPVRDLARTEPARTLHAYGARQTSSKRVTRFRAALATAQVALSMALLALTGVFAQSLGNIARVELGFDVDSVAMFTISPESSGYAPAASAALFDRLEDELAAIPGVTAAASAQVALLAGGGLETGTVVEGSDDRVGIHLNSVSSDFFRTLDVGMLAGREFSDADGGGAPARRDRQSALGREPAPRRQRHRAAHPGDGHRPRVVGVVADVQVRQRPGRSRAAGVSVTPPSDDARHGDLLRPRRAAAAGPAWARCARPSPAPLRPCRSRTYARWNSKSARTSQPSASSPAQSTAFAVLATALAGLGLYGVLAYSVAQRSREIALRFALGAPAARIRAMVLRQVGVIALTGVALGVVAALLLGRAARSLLFGVEAADPVALLGAAVVLAAVMLGAAYIPARRASRVDPMVALRYE